MTREEAIKVANEMYGWVKTDREREALETLVPELADSEDEKMRKELIFFLKEEVPMCSIKEHAEKLKKFVSYLERQKEQKPAEWSKEDDFKLGALITDIETRSGLTEAIKIKYVSFLKSLRPQPKREWSEEDEAHRKFILESLEDQIRFCKKDAEGAYYAKQIRTAQNWLNGLPNKFRSEKNIE